MIRRQSFSVFVFVIILFFLTLIIIPKNIDASQPSGSITLHHPEQVAKVGPGEDGIVEFTGEVNVNTTGIGANVQMIVVKLTVDAPWVASISPSTLTWGAQETDVPKEFTVVVKVPNFTSASRVGEIIINGTINTNPGALLTNLPPEKGIIRIAEYAQLRVACMEPYIEAVSGDNVSYQLEVKNEGNAEASITVEIKEIDDLVDLGWEFENDKSNFYINEKGEELINITVSAPSNAPISLNSFDVDTILRSGEEMDEQLWKLYLNITEEDGIDNDNGMDGLGDETDDDKNTPGFKVSYLIIVLLVSIVFLNRFQRK